MRIIGLVALSATLIATTMPMASADPDNPLYRLVDTAAQRLATADDVAANKWITGGAITDPARVNQILDGMGAAAQSHGVPAAPVRAIFSDQIAATEGVEYALFAHWKFVPGDAPANAPDLSQSRSAIDGYNTAMVNEIVANQASLTGPDCRTEVVDAVAAVTADRALDPLYQQALQAATRSYCPAI